MTTATAPVGFTQEEKRRLRLVLETYMDLVDQRIRIEHRIRNYADFGGLVAVVGEDQAQQIKMAGTEKLRAEIKKYKPDPEKDRTVSVLVKDLVEDGVAEDEAKARVARFVEAYDKAWKALEGDEAHSEMHVLSRKQEAICVKIAREKVRDHPLWTEWLQYVRGIGPVFASGIVSFFDPTISPHASAWHKYAGLDVVIERWECVVCKHSCDHDPLLFKTETVKCPKCQNPMRAIGHARRLVKGQKAGYNVRVKTLCWKIAKSFIRQKAARSGYRRLYERFKAEYTDLTRRPCNKIHKDDDGNVIPCFKAHMDAKATRILEKIFLVHAHAQWRKLLGLPVSDPFVFSELKHDRAALIEPIFDDKKPVEE